MRRIRKRYKKLYYKNPLPCRENCAQKLERLEANMEFVLNIEKNLILKLWK